MAETEVLGPILDVLLRAMPRDNLLCSACLDLFVIINKENLNPLIKHLVERYREQIKALDYLETFREILHKYDSTQGFSARAMPDPDQDPYSFESEDENGRRPMMPGSRIMMEQLAVDQAQEDYWNGSDEEEDSMVQVRAAPGGHQSSPNGGVPKKLVEYNSDEDDEGGADAVMESADAPPQDESSKENQEPAKSAGVAVVGPPPERLSEKRRREEDEEDALDKLMTHKRRNSNSSVSSAGSSAGGAPLRRKRLEMLASGRGGDPSPKGPRKIAINITSSVKAPVMGKSPPGSDDEGDK